MNSQTAPSTALAIGQLRPLVGDLFKPQPTIYWTDFLLSLAIGYSATMVYLGASALTLRQVVGFAVAVIALYRVATFMHEIVHFRRREMTAFKVGWNLLAGVPMLTPSFLYDVHLEHHNTHTYGTSQDAEYLPLAHGPWYRVLAFLVQPFVLPLYFALRFAVVVPVSFLNPRWRIWVLQRMSSNAINFRHRRELRAEDPQRIWGLVDAACCLRIWVLFIVSWIGPALTLHVPEFQQRFPGLSIEMAWRPLQMYAIAVGILCLNHLRTLVAHRYQSVGNPVSHQDQLFDSIDITGDPVFTEMICPLGLRFHALHHLFPALPYHNMGKAHRRIVAALPVDSPYHQVVFGSLFTALGAFWRGMRELSGCQPNGADLWYGYGRVKAASECDHSPSPGPEPPRSSQGKSRQSRQSAA